MNKSLFKFGIREVVATGIGAALFVVIGMIAIPTFVPNTNIQLQYAVQAFFSIVFGPFVGFLMGFIGHAVKDAMSGGLWWFWISGSGILGLVIGLFKKQFRIEEGVFNKKDIIRFNIIQILANFIAWTVAASGDYFIQKEPLNKILAQSVEASLLNGLTIAIGGTLLLVAYARTQVKSGSLKKD